MFRTKLSPFNSQLAGHCVNTSERLVDLADDEQIEDEHQTKNDHTEGQKMRSDESDFPSIFLTAR